MYNTFNGWKQFGRTVAYGARGQYRNPYGDYMFHINQTVPKTRHVSTYYDDRGRRVKRIVSYEYR